VFLVISLAVVVVAIPQVVLVVQVAVAQVAHTTQLLQYLELQTQVQEAVVQLVLTTITFLVLVVQVLLL